MGESENTKKQAERARKSKKKRKKTVKNAKKGQDDARNAVQYSVKEQTEKELKRRAAQQQAINEILNYAYVKEVLRRPPGRPSKYDAGVHPLVLECLMADGYSFEAACGAMGFEKDTGYEWTKKHDDFSNAKKRGEALSQLWWEHKGKQGMDFGKDFNATVWVFAMKNRFGWRDAKDLNVGGQAGNPLHAGGPLGAILDELNALSDDELEERVEELLDERRRQK